MELAFPLQIYLNNLANYIPSAWNNATGCTVCESQELPSDRSQWPMVVLALFVERPTPFLSEVLGSVTALDYPKQRMRLWVHSAVCRETCVRYGTGGQNCVSSVL